MTAFHHPKSMAKALRQALADRGIFLAHGQCLDVVARQHGVADWNILSAQLAGDRAALAVPEGWFVSSHSLPDHFRIGMDASAPGIAIIESVPGATIPPDQTGVLMQSVSASDYHGKKLRLSAQLRTRDAKLATIWLRVDGRNGQRSLRFDNMIGRPGDGALVGTHDWAERQIVLEVPEEAESIHFGFLLQASGTAWARAFRLETVDPDTAVTGRSRYLPRPTNLDFGEGGAPA